APGHLLALTDVDVQAARLHQRAQPPLPVAVYAARGQHGIDRRVSGRGPERGGRGEAGHASLLAREVGIAQHGVLDARTVAVLEDTRRARADGVVELGHPAAERRAEAKARARQREELDAGRE